jgi:acetyl esterase/lipase
MAALVLAMPDVRRRWIARLAAAASVAASVWPIAVLIQADSAYRQVDLAFQTAFRDSPAVQLPLTQLVRMREPVFSFAETFGWRRAPVTRESRDVPYAPRGDRWLTMDVYRPEVDQHGPAVIQFYGGGWRSGRPADNAVFARELTRLGFVVFAPDYRHAPAAHWPAQRDDARDALAWVAAHGGEYGADASRVVLVGRSSGAQLALIAGITDSTTAIRGIVALYSPVDLADGYLHPSSPDLLGTRSLESAFIGATLEDNPDAYRDASPLTYANRPHPPVLMINGGHDFVIERRFGQRLRSRLASSGTVLFVELPWAGHAFDAVPFGPGGQVALTAVERFVAVTTAR